MNRVVSYPLMYLLLLVVVRADSPPEDGSDLPGLILTARNIIVADQKLAQGNEEATNAPAAQTPTQAVKRQNKWLRILATLRINAARNDYTDAILSAEALQAGDKTPAAQSAFSSLILRLYQLRDVQEAKAAHNVKSVLDRATQLVLTSSDPRAFDSLLAEIGLTMDENRYGQFTPSHLAVTSQLIDADRFLKEWQTYLIHKETDQTVQAADDLRQIANFTETFRPVARSRILEMANDPTLSPEAPNNGKLESVWNNKR